jgi:drug/metabolite transporter (DMT)-like permease
MFPAGLSWRDRLQLVNSVLLCVVGAALIARYFVDQMPSVGAILGVGMLAFGAYRLLLARRELRKRARSSGDQ